MEGIRPESGRKQKKIQRNYRTIKQGVWTWKCREQMANIKSSIIRKSEKISELISPQLKHV